ncbi:ArpU family phage packaging/lysis transcriptional regulator [Heyndrickxia camelliae]|uniref:ArpU family transcriptional regulator n=1 Tax=Heyndrickxia camelliae TaxID=1707093 RepID=A0A2N3LJS2_9BACI|nr:ArpU family phage packaging/lysis transcriptional regulator [Heyndrickxia camelliae]PKR84878.1 ArpU family transcriptional regulator [Heyndrickxia camelliae]
MAAEQLEMFEPVDEKEVRREVARHLREYKALKVQIENINERSAAGVKNLYPSLRKISPENELKVRQMERTLLNSLNDEEREVIERKYLSNKREKDISIYTDLGYDKDRFYDIQRSAISLIATALGII